jgi:hypothetical protein
MGQGQVGEWAIYRRKLCQHFGLTPRGYRTNASGSAAMSIDAGGSLSNTSPAPSSSDMVRSERRPQLPVGWHIWMSGRPDGAQELNFWIGGKEIES